ncbi:MAG: efflux RND transporter periplasmic adaptor subunit [Desulfobacterales bacterium]|jgi:HlyD family secretion protein|nr:efflux RND transporter periplasmic adaptor subunit [Desulfobacterales bacterium]
MKNTETNAHDDIAKTLEPGAPKRRGTRLKKWLFWGVMVLVLAWIGIRWHMDRNTTSTRYMTRPVTTGDLTVTVTATGNLQPTNQVDVGSELSGIVDTVGVDYNDHVKIGQVLARLDTTKLQAQVLQSRATVEAAKAKVLQVRATITEARAQLDRLTHLAKLSERKAVSKQDLDTARATLDRALADEAAAMASVDQARAVLELNETDLSKAMILSPINGIVLVRSVEPGQTVAASLQAPVLFTLAEDLTHMELHVDVDEADVGRVRAGQKASFTVDAYPERTYPAEITQVRYGARATEGSTTTGVVTYETILNVDNTDLSLRPGMTATADIVVEEVKKTLLIPNAALRFSPPSDPKDVPAPQGGIMMKLFPRPRRSGEKQRSESSAEKKPHRVWVEQKGQPVPLLIQAGLTDGIMTQILTGDIMPGMEVIVDAVSEKP